MITEKDLVVGAKFANGKNFITIDEIKNYCENTHFRFTKEYSHPYGSSVFSWVQSIFIEHLNCHGYQLMDKPKEEKAAITLNGKERILNVTKAEELGILEDVPPTRPLITKEDLVEGQAFKAGNKIYLLNFYHKFDVEWHYTIFSDGKFNLPYSLEVEDLIEKLNDQSAVKVNVRLQTI